MSTFLTAEWKNLVNVTYRVDPEHLKPYLPKGVVLDLIDGMAHVSLVAFDFMNTKVKGIPVPFHVNFPEMNLRTYVTWKGRRGVSFLREFVPKHCIAYIARRFYNEPYLSYPMESTVDSPEGETFTVAHKIWKDGECHSLEVNASKSASIPSKDSSEYFFKEHSLGVGSDQNGKTLLYDVQHPEWEIHKVLDVKLNLDFAKLYGPEWAFLNQAKPFMVMLAKGSAVKVCTPESAE
jgi:uncharacterized protein